MSYLKSILFVVFSMIYFNLTAQELSKEERKVEIFSSEEKDNLQRWFHDEVKRMGLNEEEMSQYSSIIVYYVAKIARLDDKDKDFSEEQFKKELNGLLARQDKELEDLLTPEQFDIHKEIYGEFLRSAYRRWGITND
ncbi:hypothetical protein [Eudoraea adriatica]|uniref:hypothetical protein n=1 Tax=Eudoraea adriatica TaxID=446681 RepID=UPI00037721E8|nr:hypothetical protein [Eudoraea adriatica]